MNSKIIRRIVNAIIAAIIAYILIIFGVTSELGIMMTILWFVLATFLMMIFIGGIEYCVAIGLLKLYKYFKHEEP